MGGASLDSVVYCEELRVQWDIRMAWRGVRRSPSIDLCLQAY